MEIWDAYDRNGNKTGEILVRGEEIPEGRYHLVSEAEFVELLNSDRMIPGQPQRMEGWFRKMGYLK